MPIHFKYFEADSLNVKKIQLFMLKTSTHKKYPIVPNRTTGKSQLLIPSIFSGFCAATATMRWSVEAQSSCTCLANSMTINSILILFRCILLLVLFLHNLYWRLRPKNIIASDSNCNVLANDHKNFES